MRDGGLRSAPVITGGLVWLAVAAALGAAGVFQGLRPPGPQVLLAGLTLLVLGSAVAVARLRDWVSGVDVRALVALHVIRVVAGGWFLVLYRRGELPYAFAVPGGVGDIIVGLLALGLVALGVTSRRAYAAWNLLGLADILFVVATATRIARLDPAAMAPLLSLPLSLLPTWLVPLIIASHLILAVRLARRARPR